MSARYAREVANRPAAERLTDAQVKRIRRRRQAGELLCTLAAEHRVSTRTLRRRLTSADAGAAAKERKAAGAEPKQAGRRPQTTTAVTQTTRPQQPEAAASLPPLREQEPDQLARQRLAAAEREPVAASDRRLAHQPGSLPHGFSSWQQRLAYYEQRKLESECDWLNYRDALHGRETPAERRARQTAVRSR